MPARQQLVRDQKVKPRRGRPRLGVRLGVVLGLFLLAVGLAVAVERIERIASSPFPVSRAPAFRPGWVDPAGEDLVAEEDPAVPLAFRSGETLGGVLDGLGLAPADAGAIATEVGRFADLRRLRPDDTFRAHFTPERRLESFELILSGRGRVTAERDGGRWRGRWHAFERSVAVRVIRGRLEDSLEASIRRAGAEGMVAYLLSDVFQWDLDFNRDLRLGDEFEVAYEQVFLDGDLDSLGAILAARYSNRGRRLEAYRFGDPVGYYDSEGRPMRKMFLRSPLRFSRITSRFSRRRFHPVLQRYRPHYGVDYGAPTGTPVRVTAGGVVDFAGWDAGGGRMVKVRHPNGYLTAYLHLSKFASGVRPGRRVAQGDVVGYVGATGLATAPHLDYRVQYRGSWIDPLSLKSVPTEPLASDLLPRFMAWRDALRAALDSGEPIGVPLTAPGATAVTAESRGPAATSQATSF